MTVKAKICGISTGAALSAAVSAGGAYVGFVFYPSSPRSVTVERASELAASVPPQVDTVGLLVDPDDEMLDRLARGVRLDWLQLHGTEAPDRVEAIRRRTGLRIVKAIRVAAEDDIDAARAYEPVADMILFDGKPPKESEGVLPGGNAVSFDWRLLAGRRWCRPWMLSGGLAAANVAEAIRVSGATAVDVSSGVESALGIKDPAKIREFLKAVSQFAQK